MNTLKYKIRNHFENGFSFYFVLALVLIVGIIVGALMIKAIKTETLEILVNYSSPYFYGISKVYSKSLDFLKLSMFVNIVFAIFIYFVGMLGLGFLIPIIIFLRGLQIGIVVGYVVLNFGFKGFLISIFGLYPQYLIFIPSLIFLCSLSMIVSFKYRMNTSIRPIKMNRISKSDYTIMIMINIVILIFGSLYEGLISPHFLNLIEF
ncbi:hypothetical protein E9840_00835 [Tissierella creatinini]|nr:hypothetical protein E9840_00835 [Tissierella creatinini]TJX69103.1 hypothetical protein E8P77_00285 [Soehngenia saccharolytica]